MKYRANLQPHRARRNLSQACVQRSHRRCELIRLGPGSTSDKLPLVLPGTALPDANSDAASTTETG